MPRVSVIIPAYNHEKFVGETIESVFSQTYQDFELLITDDGSTDGTVKVIRTFTDNRIEFFQNEKNIGAVIGTNFMIQRAKGEYIAILSSDDAFMPDKLEKQVRFLDEHPQVGAVFSHAMIIDEDGGRFTDASHFYTGIFQKPNRNRFEWLNHFFFQGNCLCHPSVLIRKECYGKVGLYDPLLAQLPDYDLWIRLCMAYEIHILEEELVKFRVRANEANASGARPEVGKRSHYELFHLLGNFLSIGSIDDLVRIFPEITTRFACLSDFVIPFYIAVLAGSIASQPHQLFALDTIYALFKDSKKAEALKTVHDFSTSDLIRMTGEYDIFNRFQNWYASLYLDTGKGFNEEEKISFSADYRAREFSFRYDVSTRSPVRALRWDPGEDLYLSVQILDVSLRGKDHIDKTWDLRSISSNATYMQDGTAVFETFNPQFLIPVSGDLMYVTIKGRWTLEKYQSKIRSLEKKIKGLERAIEKIKTSRSWRITAPLRYFSQTLKSILPDKERFSR